MRKSFLVSKNYEKNYCFYSNYQQIQSLAFYFSIFNYLEDFLNYFYILIREGIRFMQNGTPPVFVKCPRFETP